MWKYEFYIGQQNVVVFSLWASHYSAPPNHMETSYSLIKNIPASALASSRQPLWLTKTILFSPHLCFCLGPFYLFFFLWLTFLLSLWLVIWLSTCFGGWFLAFLFPLHFSFLFLSLLLNIDFSCYLFPLSVSPATPFFCMGIGYLALY